MYKIYCSLFLSFFYFNVFSQTVAFTYASANGSTILCSPAVINFKPITTGTPIGFTWYFGNGLTSNSAIPSMTFTAGTYIIKLVAVFSNVALETTQTIVINPGISANFTGNRSYICKLDTVGFNVATASPNTTFEFDFADGSPQVSGNSGSIIHNFTAFGVYNTSVKATNSFGCTSTSNFLVKVVPLMV